MSISYEYPSSLGNESPELAFFTVSFSLAANILALKDGPILYDLLLSKFSAFIYFKIKSQFKQINNHYLVLIFKDLIFQIFKKGLIL